MKVVDLTPHKRGKIRKKNGGRGRKEELGGRGEVKIQKDPLGCFWAFKIWYERGEKGGESENDKKN